MNGFKTVNIGGTARGFSADGEIRVCAETKGLQRKVEVWLLNGAVNENNWRYERLEEHKRLFAETPILVAYVGNKIGDGHNFTEIIDRDGNKVPSFIGATSERIVGYFKSDSDIRFEERDGKKWIVGTGYIWTWYAVELVEKIEKQGLGGMPVSIETLVDEMHMDGSTEVFTKYQILGTTILGDDVQPAVRDARIRALSAVGADEVKKITLRVASAVVDSEPNSTPKQSATNKKKGKIRMKLNELEPKFPDYKVLAAGENGVVLMDNGGNIYLSSAEKNGAEIIVGAKTNATGTISVTDGERTVEVGLEDVIDRLNTSAELEQEKTARQAAETALATMQKNEKKRRMAEAKKAVADRLAEIRALNADDIAENECDDLITDEALEAYAEMENADGDFCGDEKARADVDAHCMTKILAAQAAKNNAAKKHFAWDVAANAAKNTPQDDVDAYIHGVLNK